jgi:hypothetical protein
MNPLMRRNPAYLITTIATAGVCPMAPATGTGNTAPRDSRGHGPDPWEQSAGGGEAGALLPRSDHPAGHLLERACAVTVS